MRKSFLLVPVILGFASVATAQERTNRDISLGYSYLREGFSNGINAQGGNLSATGYVNHWLGITGDFGAYHASPFGVSANTYTFLVGPRFAYRSQDRVMPFAQVLVGGAHLTAGGFGVSGSTSGFAWSTGGGVDLGITRRLALRPQFDYIGVHASGGTLNSGRASVGLVFRF
jgi:peptidoglycan-associated lipoprotein